MTFYCVKTVTRRPSTKKRKNARETEKKYEYVYEAHTRRDRRNQKVKHRIVGKIGPLVRAERTGEVHFNLSEAESMDKDTLIKHMIALNLHSYGFENEGMAFAKDDLNIDLDSFDVKQNEKDVVFALNDGYLCTKTLKYLFETDVREEADIPLIVKGVRDVGLLPTQIDTVDKSTGNVEGLINAISEAIGEKVETGKEEIVDKHQAFLSILLTKFQDFKVPEQKEEQMSMDKFRKEIGW